VDKPVEPVVQQGPEVEQLRVIAQEVAAQRNLLGDRAIALAVQLAAKEKRIAELEGELADRKKGDLPRAVK